MSVKIVISELQKKAFLVETSNRNMDAAMVVQLKMAEADDTDDLEPKEIMSLNRSALRDSIDFISKTLKLDEKMQDKLWDMDYIATLKLASRIALRIQGMTEAEYKKAVAPTDEETVTDPKTE